MNSPPVQQCNLQMGCKVLCYCSHQDLIHDTTQTAWMRATPPPLLDFHSDERRRATDRLAEQESQADMLTVMLDEARIKAEAAFKLVDDISQQLELAKLAVTKSRMSLSPIRLVPNEILGYIFACMDPPDLPDHLEDITRLCCVSKAWNTAVHLAPELWTNWSIDTSRHLAPFVTTPDFKFSVFSQALDRFLPKAMNRHLNFEFTNSEIETDVDWLPLVNVITNFLPRWNTVRYLCNVPESPRNACLCSALFVSLNMGQALKDLAWTHCRYWTLADEHSQVIKVDTLNTLSLTRSLMPIPYFETPALTDLSLCDLQIDWEDVSNLARSLPNLLILHCNEVTLGDSEDESAPPIIFQILREFHMSYWDPDDESSAVLAHVILQHAPTVSMVHRYINILGTSDRGSALDPDLCRNILLLEFHLAVMPAIGMGPICSSLWNTPSEVKDWLHLPNLTTLSLIWTPGSRADPSEMWGNNNRLAALLLDTISTVGNDPDMGICPRLEHVKCRGVICNKPLVGKSGTEAFLLALENFSWNRSRMADAPNSSTESTMCLVSVAWNAAANSAGLPDLVNANWEDVNALLDDISVETDTNASDLSDEEENEASEGSGDWSDSEESSRVAEEEEDSDDSSWLGEEERAERAAEEKYLRAITFKSHHF